MRKVMVLRSIPLFFSDDIAALIAMSYATHLPEHKRGEVLVREGRRPPMMHVILEGTVGVSVTLRVGEGLQAETVRVHVATLTPGMPFGTESIIAATDRELAAVSRPCSPERWTPSVAAEPHHQRFCCPPSSKRHR